MKILGGFTQDELTEIWDSLGGDNPNPSAKKVVDDNVEQVMIVKTSDGVVSISRVPDEEWFDTPDVGGKDFV